MEPELTLAPIPGCDCTEVFRGQDCPLEPHEEGGTTVCARSGCYDPHPVIRKASAPIRGRSVEFMVLDDLTPTPPTSPHQDVLVTLPATAGDRKSTPITTGVLDYFPAAIAEVARLSKAGNDQHNPGQPLHWARGKSTDHADCIVRHLIQRDTLDTDGIRHSAKVAWRALALLQEEIEREAGFVPGGGA